MQVFHTRSRKETLNRRINKRDFFLILTNNWRKFTFLFAVIFDETSENSSISLPVPHSASIVPCSFQTETTSEDASRSCGQPFWICIHSNGFAFIARNLELMVIHHLSCNWHHQLINGNIKHSTLLRLLRTTNFIVACCLRLKLFTFLQLNLQTI